MGLWIFVGKIFRLVPHFCRHPDDMKYIPLAIGFGYFHGFLNLYALCALHQTQWGSQQLDVHASNGPDGSTALSPAAEASSMRGGPM